MSHAGNGGELPVLDHARRPEVLENGAGVIRFGSLANQNRIQREAN
jgi:hypothetical protein